MQNRVLLCADAVTFSHIARLEVIASWLTDLPYVEIHTSFADKYNSLVSPGFIKNHHRLSTIPGEQFTAAVNNLKFPYTEADLKCYVDEELSVIDRVRPDLIIGDFRITLAISARLRKVPLFTLSNAYWSPYFNEPVPNPHNSPLAFLPRPLGDLLFSWVSPLAYRSAGRAFNRVAYTYGIKEAQGALPKIYTQGDVELFCEPPNYLRMKAPERHHWLGPLSWRPQLKKPFWMDQLNPHAGLVFVSLGSSGNTNCLDPILESLSGYNLQIIIAGKALEVSSNKSSKVFCAEFLDPAWFLPHAQLAITNGGSLSMVEALRFGVPILAIISNYDQHLNMSSVADRNWGRWLADHNLSSLKAILPEMLKWKQNHSRALENAQELFAQADQRASFLKLVGAHLNLSSVIGH